MLLHSVQTGRIAPLGPEGVRSGFVKSPFRRGRSSMGSSGWRRPEQADLRCSWRARERPFADIRLIIMKSGEMISPNISLAMIPGGSRRENLTIKGMTETDICIGDIHWVGTAPVRSASPCSPVSNPGPPFQ